MIEDISKLSRMSGMCTISLGIEILLLKKIQLRNWPYTQKGSCRQNQIVMNYWLAEYLIYQKIMGKNRKLTCNSESVGFWPRSLINFPKSEVLTMPSASVSTALKHFWISPICASDKMSAIIWQAVLIHF